MNVQVELSASSLDALLDQLDSYAESLDARCSDISLELGEAAAETARLKVRSFTGETEASIAVSHTHDGYDVTATGPGVVYHEFGTGIGAAPTNPATSSAMTESGFVHDTALGESGWVFPGKDGEFYTTHGQDAAGFMGSGAEAARDAITDTARRVFST